MLQAILVWSGAVLAIAVLLLMAVGPVIVELDSWWYARRHKRRQRKAAAVARMQPPARQPVRPAA